MIFDTNRVGSLAAVLFMTLGLPAALAAQLHGTVRDRTGSPLQSVRVELLDAASVLAATVTDAEGRFSFRPVEGARAVRASSIGFSTATVSVNDRAREIEITLLREPIELPGVDVLTSRIECREDEPRARRLWRHVRSRYPMPDSSSHWAARILEIRAGRTRLEDFGRVGESRFVWAQTGGNWRAGSRGEERLAREGFAVRMRTSVSPKEEAWNYAALEGAQAFVLLTDAFGSRHDLVIQEESEEAVVLAFCPKDDDVPVMSGRMLLTPDLGVRKTEWRFQTPEPFEDAGGEARFDPDSKYLLPTSAVFWRRTQVGEYYQEAVRYSEWFVGSEEEVRAGLRRVVSGSGG